MYHICFRDKGASRFCPPHGFFPLPITWPTYIVATNSGDDSTTRAYVVHVLSIFGGNESSMCGKKGVKAHNVGSPPVVQEQKEHKRAREAHKHGPAVHPTTLVATQISFANSM